MKQKMDIAYRTCQLSGNLIRHLKRESILLRYPIGECIIEMQWLPPWLGKAYARIYAEKKTEQFQFSEAASILSIYDERRLAKTLAKIKESGQLIVRRDPLDARRKLFNLIDPASATIAYAMQSRAKSSELIEKLKVATGLLEYYVSGAYAAYQYHRYSAPGSVDLSVKADQLPTWVALASGKDTAISINEVLAEKPSSVNVHFRTNFDPKLAEDTTSIEGVRYLSPELLIVLGLAQGYPSLEDVLAILVVQRKKLEWDELLTLCRAYNATRYLGFLLELLNFESGKTLFNPKRIKKIAARADVRAKLDFPVDKKSEPPEQAYSVISSRWNLVLHSRRALFSKIITDLVRA